MPLFADTRHAPKCLFAALFLLAAGTQRANSQEPKAQLGLSSAGGIGVFLGAGSAVHNVSGGEGGGLVDLGWIGSPRIRMVGDASWFIGSLHEFVAQDNRDFSGPVFDLSSSVSLMALSGSTSARQSAYASLGFSIHALSSSLGSLPLDARYNANRFGVTAAVGGRFWVGEGGQGALFVELREHRVTAVNRWTVRAGFMHNFAPLTRPARH